MWEGFLLYGKLWIEQTTEWIYNRDNLAGITMGWKGNLMDKRLDLLDRDEFIENVVKIVNQLSDINRGCCFAIEGGWGVGKTFVIEEIEERLKVIQSEETNCDRYFVFHPPWSKPASLI